MVEGLLHEIDLIGGFMEQVLIGSFFLSSRTV
jgi:hypothetical protein